MKYPKKLPALVNLGSGVFQAPSEKRSSKEPVMTCDVIRTYGKKGITSTLYDPRINASRHDDRPGFLNLQSKLKKIDNRIGFAHLINNSMSSKTSTKYGDFIVGSPLSYHLSSLHSCFPFETNLCVSENVMYTNHHYIYLPLEFLLETHDAYPNDWNDLSYDQFVFLNALTVDCDKAYEIEQETILQSGCPKWFEYRQSRITSSICHSIFRRKRNFDTFVINFSQTNGSKTKISPRSSCTRT